MFREILLSGDGTLPTIEIEALITQAKLANARSGQEEARLRSQLCRELVKENQRLQERIEENDETNPIRGSEDGGQAAAEEGRHTLPAQGERAAGHRAGRVSGNVSCERSEKNEGTHRNRR